MWTVVLCRDDEQASDHGQLTDTGQRSLAFVADWVARSQHDRLDVTFVDADRTRWMGRGEPDDVDLGADREGDHWRLFLTLGDVLELPRERALEGFLAHLEVERPRLREAIVESRSDTRERNSSSLAAGVVSGAASRSGMPPSATRIVTLRGQTSSPGRCGSLESERRRAGFTFAVLVGVLLAFPAEMWILPALGVPIGVSSEHPAHYSCQL